MLANGTALLTQLVADPLLAPRLVRRTLAKGSHVIRQNEVATDVFIVRSGLVKLYYITLDGTERVKSFLVEGDLFGSRSCQMTGKGSPFAAICLEDAQLVCLPYVLFREMLMSQPPLMEFMFFLTEQIGLKKEQREYELLCRTAQERYLAFIGNEPQLAARLSQMDIARYLGITPIALSRIKKRLRLAG